MSLGLGNPFASTSDDRKPVLFGRMGFFDNEWEVKIPNVIQDAFVDAPKFFLDPTKDLSKETYAAVKDLLGDIFSRGSIDFQKPKDLAAEKKSQEAAFKKSFYQNMESIRKDTERSSVDRAMEETSRLMVSAMPTEEKNKTLNLNRDLRAQYTNNPYHIHTLRRIKLEELRKMQQQKQDQQVTATGKKSGLLNNMNAHEGQSMTSSSGAIMSAG